MEKDNWFSKYWGWVAGLIFIFVFAPLISVGYTTNDETHIYFCQRFELLRLFPELLASCKLAFYGFLVNQRPSLPSAILTPFLGLFSSLYNYPHYMRAAAICFHALNLCLFYWLLKNIFRSKAAGYLGIIIFLAFVQNSWEHNLLVSYFTHTLVFSFVLMSFTLFLKGLDGFQLTDRRNDGDLVLSAVFYFFSLSYETSLVYFPVFFALAWQSNTGNRIERLKQTFKNCAWVSGVTVLFLSVYFLFRYFVHPDIAITGEVLGLDGLEANGGYNISVGIHKIGDILRVIAGSACVGLPGVRYVCSYKFISQYCSAPWSGPLDIAGLLRNIQLLWLLKAAIVAAALYYLPRKIIARTAFPIWALIVSGIYLFFAPGMPISLVEVYQHWAKMRSFGLINTYHSLFGFIFILMAIAAWINTKIIPESKSGKILALIFAIAGGAVSICTDFSNNAYTVSQIQSAKKWEMMDVFLASPEYKALPNGSVIYAPSLFDRIGIMAVFPPYWTDYAAHKTGQTINILNRPELIRDYVRRPRIVLPQAGTEQVKIVGTIAELKKLPGNVKTEKLYYLKYSQEQKNPNQFILFSKIRRADTIGTDIKLYADSAKLFALTKYRELTVFGSIDNPAGVHILKTNNGETLRFTGNYFSMPLKAGPERIFETEFTLPGLMPEAVAITGFPVQFLGSVIKLNYGAGVYAQEGGYRWCEKNSEVLIANESNQSQTLELKALFAAGDAISSLEIKGPGFRDEIKLTKVPVAYSRKIAVGAKSVVKIQFISFAERVSAPGDPRHLYFKMMAFSVN